MVERVQPLESGKPGIRFSSVIINCGLGQVSLLQHNFFLLEMEINSAYLAGLLNEKIHSLLVCGM